MVICQGKNIVLSRNRFQKSSSGGKPPCPLLCEGAGRFFNVKKSATQKRCSPLPTPPLSSSGCRGLPPQTPRKGGRRCTEPAAKFKSSKCPRPAPYVSGIQRSHKNTFPLVLNPKLVYHREEGIRKAPENADKGAGEYFITGMYRLWEVQITRILMRR